MRKVISNLPIKKGPGPEVFNVNALRCQLQVNTELGIGMIIAASMGINKKVVKVNYGASYYGILWCY